MNRKPVKKKKFGQHFLRKQSVVDHMIDRVTVGPQASVLEIGCGDGFLTRSILAQTKCVRLWVYEIDPEWATLVREQVTDKRLTVHEQNILELDWNALELHKPWVLLSNLPYQITFPILFLIQKNKQLFAEGVVMVQEEVAQKLVATGGKSYSATALFLQQHLIFELMEKIEPMAFDPPPKVFSRLVYFKSRFDAPSIPDEDEFWKFVKLCFRAPRQTLKNNLRTAHYDYTQLSEEQLCLRAQQLSFDDFLVIWDVLRR